MVANAFQELQTFVGNRVAEIQSLCSVKDWRHVSSHDNPADYISRGMFPMSLLHLNHWWHGPDWLTSPESAWPQLKFIALSEIPELRAHTLATFQISDLIPLHRFSSLLKLQRTIATCFRFIQNCRGSKNSNPLSTSEIDYALITIVRLLQQDTFSKEYSLLVNKRPLHTKSQLRALSPFMDEAGVIRVGGRISKSTFGYDKIHPILIPKKGVFSKLLFEQYHRDLCHAGPQMLLYTIREKFWPLGGRDIARRTVFECVRCFRAKPRFQNPLMGELPNYRITVSLPFTNVGVDYAGPYFLRDRKGRGAKYFKGYICLFICLATKAVHIEVVSDLTTEAFLACLHRFTSRRGIPSMIMSDNGRTFVGAARELNELYEFFRLNSGYIENAASSKKINWKFIPAYSPHFGIWEAGIKSCKHHLSRIAKDAKLTFEQLTTLTAQIEAILNSRPLVPMSSDPADLRALTPAHFLIGHTLVQPLEADLTNVKETRLSHFERIQQLAQHFWTRWQMEYISELQSRTKWRDNKFQLQLNSLVIIKDEHAPSTKWMLGRVVQLHPGSDKICRVATVKTASGDIKRSFSKLCVLPIETDINTD